MADVVEEIKAKLGIVDLVSQYVQLKKAGRNFKGLCPFHSESTPSFVVSPEKQICHCFGCSKGGDIFSFIQEIEGIGFTEALQFLADKTGVKLEKSKMKKSAQNKSEKEEYFKAHDLAAKFFQKQLFETEPGKKVLDYLSRRGVNEDTIREFSIGFAPDSYDSLHPYLLKQGIRQRVLLDSGLVSTKKTSADQIYDKYRARLIFPIFDYLGRICGFGGRALKKDQMPKYLNSPENLIYNKSNILYGLSHGKQSVKEVDELILVEGYFDVLLPYQAGIKNVAATSGTALTKEHVKLISRLTKNVLTCFDADGAGFEATKRGYQLLADKDMVVRTTADFDGKDPADFVRADAEAFKKVVTDAKPFVSFYISKLVGEYDGSSYAGRMAILREILPILKKMSATGKDLYVRELSKLLNLQQDDLYDEINNFSLPKEHPVHFQEKSEEITPEKFGYQALIAGILESHNHMLEKAEEFLPKSVYKEVHDQYNLACKSGDLPVYSLYCEQKYDGFSEESLLGELEALVQRMLKQRLETKLADLRRQIAEAEESDNKGKLLELLQEQQEFNQQKQLISAIDYGEN